MTARTAALAVVALALAIGASPALAAGPEAGDGKKPPIGAKPAVEPRDTVSAPRPKRPRPTDGTGPGGTVTNPDVRPGNPAKGAPGKPSVN